jgi:hypothetical protein
MTTRTGDDRTPGAEGLASGDRALLESLAAWLAERRMTVPAVLFLESVKPLNFVGSQAMYFFEPMVKAFFTGDRFTRFARILESRENVEILVRLIEAAEEDLRSRRQQEKNP